MPVEVCILCVAIPEMRSERGRGTCNVERKRSRQERDMRAWETRIETLERVDALHSSITFRKDLVKDRGDFSFETLKYNVPVYF